MHSTNRRTPPRISNAILPIGAHLLQHAIKRVSTDKMIRISTNRSTPHTTKCAFQPIEATYLRLTRVSTDRIRIPINRDPPTYATTRISTNRNPPPTLAHAVQPIGGHLLRYHAKFQPIGTHLLRHHTRFNQQEPTPHATKCIPTKSENPPS